MIGSLKLFGNSWSNSYAKLAGYTRYHVSFPLWLIGSVLKHCKVPKYYDQDCRSVMSIYCVLCNSRRCLFIGCETAFAQNVMLDSWNFAALTFNSIIVFSYCSWYFFTFNRSSCPLLYSFPFLKILVSLSMHFYKMDMFLQEAFGQRCSVKKAFLEIWQNSQENTCVRVSFRHCFNLTMIW